MPEKGFLWVDTPNRIDPAQPAEDEPAFYRDVLVAGAGVSALAFAGEAASLGYRVVLASSQAKPDFCGADEDQAQAAGLAGELPRNLELLAGVNLARLSGAAGGFTAWLEGPQGEELREFGAVALCPPAQAEPAAHAPGLDRDKLVPLAGLKPESYAGKDGQWLHAAVLAGPDEPVTAFEFDQAVRAALALQQRPLVQAYLFFSEARVALEGGERRYRQARDAGVIIVRLAPGGLKVEDGGSNLGWVDPILDQEVSLSPDLLVCGQSFKAQLPAFLDNELLWPSRRFLLPQGATRLQGGKTARSGLYILGAARGTAPGDDRLAEAAAAAADLHERLSGAEPGYAPPVVDHDKCASCLTCVRVCPHGVPHYGLTRIECAPAACLACGICAAECPAEAIAPPGWENRELFARLAKAMERERKPELVLFACRGSAAPALEELSAQGYQWPLSMAVIPLNCVGRVGEQLILKALALGASGVLAAGCHDGNCRSVTGNLRARLRVKESKGLLERLGLNGVVRFLHLASNQPATLARALEDIKREMKGS